LSFLRVSADSFIKRPVTIEWLHCKLQTRPLVREGAP
jgi:hypothetical protein